MGIFNLLSTSEYIAGNEILKEEIILAIEQNTAELKASVEALIGRVNDLVGPLRDANANLVATLAAEREAAATLAASEDAEDVDQNRALDEARAATDEALRVQDAAAVEIQTLKGQIDSVLAAPAAETPDAPVETPAPETPAVEEPAAEVPAPVEPATEEPAVETPAVDEPVADETPVLPDAPVVTDPADVETPADAETVVTDPATDDAATDNDNPTVV